MFSSRGAAAWVSHVKRINLCLRAKYPLFCEWSKDNGVRRRSHCLCKLTGEHIYRIRQTFKLLRKTAVVQKCSIMLEKSRGKTVAVSFWFRLDCFTRSSLVIIKLSFQMSSCMPRNVFCVRKAAWMQGAIWRTAVSFSSLPHQQSLSDSFSCSVSVQRERDLSAAQDRPLLLLLLLRYFRAVVAHNMFNKSECTTEY